MPVARVVPSTMSSTVACSTPFEDVNPGCHRLRHNESMAGQSTQWRKAARVLRRSGFGVSGREVDAVVVIGAQEYISAVLAILPSDDPGAAATPAPVFVQPAPPSGTATHEDMVRYYQQVWQQLSDLQLWWLRRMLAIHHPIHERLTLIWHDHFATSMEKVAHAAAMYAQNEKLRTLGRGDFRLLAQAMLTDPAMIFWLDGQMNTKEAPNENLARETIELFCLGHGSGYSERDVKAAAASLTGLTITPSWVVDFQPALHDYGRKSILGLTGPLNGWQFLDAVLARSESPRFVVDKLWKYFASDDKPPKPALDRAVAAYGLNRDVRATVQAILFDPTVIDARPTRVIPPIEWLIGAARALQFPPNDASARVLQMWLQDVGQAPFAPPNVGGWPSGQAWLTTAGIAQRAAASMVLAKSGDTSIIEDAAIKDRIDTVGYLLGIGAWSSSTFKTLTRVRKDPTRLTATALNSPEYLTC